MRRKTKLAIFGTLATATAGAALTGLMSTSASAINEVGCGPSDYTKLVLHYTGEATAFDLCFANGGEMAVSDRPMWVTEIVTGVNHVKWYGDGRWQPDEPIGPGTDFTWANHPQGVEIEKIRIV